MNHHDALTKYVIMNRLVPDWFLLPLLLLPGVLGSLGPWVQVERFVVPRHVALGTNVSLECDYQVQEHATLYSLKWYKGSSQFYQYIPSKTEPHAVFSVPGLHQNQLVSGRDGRVVTVVGVGMGASDVYRCELVAEGPPFHTTQRSANMTVVVLPPGPPIITGSQNYYQLNQRLHLNCSAPPARPAPTLTWILNGHKVVSGGSVVMVERLTSPAGLERVTTQLRLRVASHHFHGGAMTIVCEARVGALYARSDQVEIREPSSTWFASPNLYHTSGTGSRSPPSSLVKVSVWLLLLTVLHLLLLLLLL